MMRLNVEYTDFMPPNSEATWGNANSVIPCLEKFLEDEFCHWDIDMAFDWDTLQFQSSRIEIGFREFK